MFGAAREMSARRRRIKCFQMGVFWSFFLKVKEHESVYQKGK